MSSQEPTSVDSYTLVDIWVLRECQDVDIAIGDNRLGGAGIEHLEVVLQAVVRYDIELLSIIREGEQSIDCVTRLGSSHCVINEELL